MTRIADLLERGFSSPVEDIVKVDNDDPDTVFMELTEYVATENIKAAYESLFSLMAAAAKSATDDVGVWISGFFGSGKSSFVKNLGYVLANRDVQGSPASSLFLKRVESRRLAQCIEFLNRTAPYEVFMLDVQAALSGQTREEPVAEIMYRVLLRNLDYAEDYEIAGMEMQLEREDRLDAFQDLCRAEYQEAWQTVRKSRRKFERASALLHRLDPRTYAATDTWLNRVRARPPMRPSVRDLVQQSFDLCEMRRPGKALAFILDEMDDCGGISGENLQNLHSVVAQFGKESLARSHSGKIPGPTWIVVASQRTLESVYGYLPAHRMDLPKLQDRFQHQIDLSGAGIGEVATRRVLHKKESHEPILRKLFRDCGAVLNQNVKLERCSRRTEFSEDQFVQLYPYLPHLIDLSIDIMGGIRLHPHAPKPLAGRNGTILKQTFEMVSDHNRLADQPAGALVSLDQIYDLIEAQIPPEKQKDIRDICRRFDGDQDYPGMAARVAKALCLMEFAKTDLPRTTRNIAALLVRQVRGVPPATAVAAILLHLKEAKFARETEDGWNLYGLDELRTVPAVLDGRNQALGSINPRLPGWHNDLIQFGKRWLARSLTWYTHPLREFNGSLTRSIQGIIWALDHLSMNMVAFDSLSKDMATLDQLSMDVIALERRLAQSEKRNAALAAIISLQNASNAPFYIEGRVESPRTTYVIGLFGSGRRYINELMLQHLGERAKYFRDTIRLHPGPTPMIYSGHATLKYVSRAQALPEVMTRIMEAVRCGFADLIFVYRHPLDSLLTSWVWWRTYLRDNRAVSGISQVYKDSDELCADLAENFAEFMAFAEGDPDFFRSVPGPRFLSFPEFVEETELHLHSATLALRLEDFMVDPGKEFSKIVEVMSADLDLDGLDLEPPKSRPFGYLAAQRKVSRFREFVDGLDADTKRRIEKMGYEMEAVPIERHRTNYAN